MIVEIESVAFGMFCQVFYLLKSVNFNLCGHRHREWLQSPRTLRTVRSFWHLVLYGTTPVDWFKHAHSLASSGVARLAHQLWSYLAVKIVTSVPTGSPKWLVSPVRYAIEMPDFGALIANVWRHGWSQVMVCRFQWMFVSASFLECSEAKRQLRWWWTPEVRGPAVFAQKCAYLDLPQSKVVSKMI